MTIATHELKAGFAFVARNFNLTKRYRGWEVAFLVYAIAGVGVDALVGSVWSLLLTGAVLIPLGIHVFLMAERFAEPGHGRLKRVG
jgi:hypothetical protein